MSSHSSLPGARLSAGVRAAQDPRGRLIDAYVCLVGLLIAGYACFAPGIYHEWSAGDWLINYQGGFVRRGLAGTPLLLLSRLSGLSPVLLSLLLGLLVYAVLLVSLRRLVRQSSRSVWVLAALVSPAGLSFQLLDPYVGFRKELILLSALAWLLAYGEPLLRRRAATTVFMLVVCTLTILSHEGMICFLPYLFAALPVCGRGVRDSLRLCVLPCLAAVAAAATCALHPGDAEIARRICASLGLSYATDGTSMCRGGPISFLGMSPAAARAQTAQLIAFGHYWRLYPPLVVLALLPALAGSRQLRAEGRTRGLRIVWLAAAAGWAGSLPLFLFAEDWGRWIYINALCLTLLLLRLDRCTRPLRAAQPLGALGRLRLAALALYGGLWTLPHFVWSVPERLGYVGLLATTARHML